MAEVYRAKLTGEEGFEKPVVLKKMLPHLSDEIEMTNHFIDEARLAAQLKHENIIHIYDFGSVENTFFIVMEYLFGKDLNLIGLRIPRPLGVVRGNRFYQIACSW
jgi:serine/threonine protein kinase